MQFLCTVYQPIAKKRLAHEIIDGKQSVVWRQALNRVHVQKSIINWCFKLG